MSTGEYSLVSTREVQKRLSDYTTLYLSFLFSVLIPVKEMDRQMVQVDGLLFSMGMGS